MTHTGWLVLLGSVLGVVLLFAWCVYKVFTIPEESKRVHGFEQETPDTHPSRRNAMEDRSPGP